MQSPSNTTVGIIGSGALATLLAQRLGASCSIVSCASQGNALAFASRTKLVLWADPSADLDATSELAAALQRGTTVVDLTGGDPDQARGMAEALAARGIAFVDAPIHCEQLSCCRGRCSSWRWWGCRRGCSDSARHGWRAG